MRLEIAPARSSASCRVTMPSRRPSTPADAPLEYAQEVRCGPFRTATCGSSREQRRVFPWRG
jgi:hypothetical protein